MQSTAQLQRLFNYDMWANEQVLTLLQQNLPFTESDQCIKYVAHIAGAQELWLRRIKGSSLEDLEVWPDYGLSAAQQRLKTVSGNWKRLVESNCSNLDKLISYQNSKGIFFDTKLSDILHHIIIHGQHHRAQIAQLLRKCSITPPATDFIFYSRSH